jgi:hypothetical protein
VNPHGDVNVGPLPDDKSTWDAKPLTFLGMHFDSQESKKLWTILEQSIARQIQKDKDKAIQALKEDGRRSRGED